MISTANITMQFGAKPLFEDVSVKFGDGHRYGLIGANGCGKSTFMKILGGELEPTHGNVSIEPERARRQAAPGPVRLRGILRDRHGDHGPRASSGRSSGARAPLLAAVDERGGRPARRRAREPSSPSSTATPPSRAAGELLLGRRHPGSQHYGPMSAVAPGWKLRVLLAQALFANPDIMLLDEPTNHLDIDTIRWLESVLTERKCTMIIISHDRHFLNTRVHAHGRPRLRRAAPVPGQLRRVHDRGHAGPRAAALGQREEEGANS